MEIKKIKTTPVNLIKSKHNQPDIAQKTILLLFSMLLLFFAYPLLKDQNLSPLVKILSGSFLMFTGIIFLIFLFEFIKDNGFKLVYYLSEFFIILFGIYGIIMIKEIFSSTTPFTLFRISSMILIFMIAAILFDLREIFKSFYEGKIEDFMRVESIKDNPKQ
jgi:hypothetical protein